MLGLWLSSRLLWLSSRWFKLRLCSYRMPIHTCIKFRQASTKKAQFHKSKYLAVWLNFRGQSLLFIEKSHQSLILAPIRCSMTRRALSPELVTGREHGIGYACSVIGMQKCRVPCVKDGVACGAASNERFAVARLRIASLSA